MNTKCLLVGVALMATSCIPAEVGFKLGVPYRSQEQFNYCAPTSVLMWRLYHGLPEISQQSIFNWMGGQGCTNQLRIRDAVNEFTSTHDAYWDNDSSANYRAMASRQISSLDNGTPVIVVVRFNHTGVLNGGRWHSDGSLYVWDFVYFHDPNPAYGSNLRLSAADWLDEFCPSGQVYCDQIISAGASANWQAHLFDYGRFVLTGGGGRGGGADGPPPAY